MYQYITSFVLSFLFSLVSFAQQVPAKPQSAPITIVGATLHTGEGTVVENASFIFEKGIITQIGNQNLIPKGQVIQLNGAHVYPGFIALNSTLGLGEIDAVRASMDIREIGQITPNIRSLIAYNAESKVVESMRPNGVLLAQIVPRGGRITGSSSVVQLDAWNWEDAAVKIDEGIHVNWPSAFTRGRWWLGESSAYKPNENYLEQVEELRSFLMNAKAYLSEKPKERNLTFESVAGLFDGTQSLYINATTEKEITDAVYFAKAFGISKTVLVGAYHAYKTIDLLKAHDIAVIVPRTQDLPRFEDDDYDLPYKMAKLLSDAGIVVSIDTSGDMERMNTRNLPFYAGQVVGQGLEKEKALQLITLNAAKILGIDERYGSLKVGKSATFFVATGDALDPIGNQLKHAFIDGRAISLESHQTELYQRYSEKFGK
ncbi:MAG: amidohydrolase family protein [Flavobacteriaceae bacterium]|nr:amidohydrolase family protein [Flavobacteriaceae bacterium]